MILDGGHCKVSRSLNLKCNTKFFYFKKRRSFIHCSGFSVRARGAFFNLALPKKVNLYLF